jgi:Ribonuclease G/E
MELRYDVLDDVRLAAIIDRDRQLVGLYAQPNDERGWLGDIYTAQVTRYAPAMRAYFLDIGEEKEAFLPHKDDSSLSPGQKIMVQVDRPATSEKQMRMTLLDVSDGGPPGKIGLGPDVVGQAQRDYPMAQLVLERLEDYDATILELLKPKIAVQDGVNIIIERTKALTAIDVNNADPEMKPLEVNRAVTKTIAQQLRLRNLNGQILIDYLRLRDPKHRTSLQSTIQQAVTLDPCAVQLFGFTKLGLFELTRTKRGLPLAEVFALAKV